MIYDTNEDHSVIIDTIEPELAYKIAEYLDDSGMYSNTNIKEYFDSDNDFPIVNIYRNYLKIVATRGDTILTSRIYLNKKAIIDISRMIKREQC